MIPPTEREIIRSGRRYVLRDMKAGRRWRAGLAAVAGVLAVAAAIDLWIPHRHDLREFDPARVADLETAMWRSYYSHERLPLFWQLTALLRTQYGFPPLRSCMTAFHAARAAAIFQQGHGRAEYERALPDLVSFYSAIASGASQRFDVRRAAKLELEWWIVHRERANHRAEDLPDSLAALQAELYGMPANAFAAHARDRASAMLLRDSAAERGGPDEREWREIGGLLARSWREAWSAGRVLTFVDGDAR